MRVVLKKSAASDQFYVGTVDESGSKKTKTEPKYKVIGADDRNGVFQYLLKDENDLCFLVTSDEAIKMCPMSIIEFYEKRVLEQYNREME